MKWNGANPVLGDGTVRLVNHATPRKREGSDRTRINRRALVVGLRGRRTLQHNVFVNVVQAQSNRVAGAVEVEHVVLPQRA